MTPAVPTPSPAPLPGRGERVVLDGLPGGPWTTVVEREGDAMLELAPPRLGGRPVPLPLHRAFTLAWTVREVPCEADARLVSGPGPGEEGRYEAHTIGPARRMQRRGAVRVPVNPIVHYRLGDDTDADADVIGAVTENLSGGGTLLRLASPIEAGTRLQVTVHCGGQAGDLTIGAVAVRCDRLEAGDRPWRIALAFDDLAA
ncbi:MAG TPA: PilZ domain-containing protein, partial [Miltoncostaea sp.]|nr:PilZ domain-containing protein [Miltoncostaea sp.]